MTHSFKGPLGTIFIHNSDLSGGVRLIWEGVVDVVVPGADLLAFVADFVRRERISMLEDMEDRQVLGLTVG